MRVCHCYDVSDRTIRRLARDGATHREVVRACRAGTSCGGCRPLVKELVADEHALVEQRAEGLAAAS